MTVKRLATTFVVVLGPALTASFFPPFIPLWDESMRDRRLLSPRPSRQFNQQQSRSLQYGGGGGRVSGRRWKSMADDASTASRQEARHASYKSPFIYTRLDDEHHPDTSAISAGQRDMQLILQVMEKAAYLAGGITRATSGRIAVQMTKANERDLVTQSDLQCQRLIRDVLTKEFPNDVFLGEEEDDGVGVETDNTNTLPSSDALMNSLNSISQVVGERKEDRLLFIVVRVEYTLLH